MGKKSKTKKPKVEFSSSGVWMKTPAGTWNLQEDRRYSVYRGATDETHDQWFLVRSAPLEFFMLRSPEPVTPTFLGRADKITAALDFADAEIARRRFEESQKENA